MHKPGFSLSFTGLKYYLAQAAAAGAAILALPILTRIYPPAIYGRYLLVVSAAVLINSLCMHWLGQSAARFLPGNEEQENLRRQINSLAMLMALGAGLMAAVGIGLVPDLDADLPLLLMAIPYSFLLVIAAVQATVHQALENSARFALFLLVQGVVPPVLAVGLSYVAGPTLAVLLGSQVAGALLAILGLEVGPLLRFARPEPEVVRRFLRYGLPLLAWILSAQLLNSLDRFMLVYYFGPEIAGIYTTNYNLVISAQSFLFGPLLLTVHPRLMKLWNNNDVRYLSVLYQAIDIFVIGAALSLAFFTIHSQSIGQLLMAETYRPGNGLMPWIALGHCLWGYAAYLNKELEFNHQTWKMALFAFAAVGVNFLLNLLLMPVYGMAAAAATTVFAYAVYLIMTYYCSPRQMKLLPGPVALRAMVLIPLILYAVQALINVLVPVPAFTNLVLILVVGALLFVAALCFNLRKEFSVLFPR